MLRLSSASALAAAIAITIAGCGGAAKTTTQTALGGSSARPSPGAPPYRFAACMRSHGVTDFPDPQVKTDGNQVSVMIRLTPSITQAPAYSAARRACAHLLPSGGPGSVGPSPAQQRAHTRALLAFATCMRRHGFPRFPDPSTGGQLSLQAVQSAGINLQEPALKPAAESCAALTHGVITRADVAQAIAHPDASGSKSQASG